MRNLIRAELLRLRTTRATYGWAAAVPIALVLVIATAIDAAGDGGQAALATSEGIRHVLAAAASATSATSVLGILAMTGEYRHNTATATFLVTPDRGRVVAARLAALAVVGLVIAVAAELLTLAIALPWMAAKGVHVDLLSGDIGLVFAGALLATVLYGAVGVGLGAVIGSQTAAVALSFAWAAVIEGALGNLVPAVGRWLPGGAAGGLTFQATPNGGLLPMWAGGLLLAAYGLAFALVGTRFVVRRDVT
ncbi:MAG: ABC transporter permease [Acidimicrobiales bacterium]